VTTQDSLSAAFEFKGLVVGVYASLTRFGLSEVRVDDFGIFR
jgi:hypothetical protein